MGKTAILVDGGFYRRRVQKLQGEIDAEIAADDLAKYCYKHIEKQKGQTLYRVFYYDCPPMETKVYHPLTKKQTDFSKTPLYTWMNIFLEKLTTKRKFALRLGTLATKQAHYNLRYDQVKKICNGSKQICDLCEKDFEIDVSQKGVDMKIGIDIASLAYKQQIDQIILISGDSDFVPAAKLARREGIDFILDNMCAIIKPDLQEHIDGIKTLCRNK